MRSPLHDAAAQRRGLAVLAKVADGQALAAAFSTVVRWGRKPAAASPAAPAVGSISPAGSLRPTAPSPSVAALSPHAYASAQLPPRRSLRQAMATGGGAVARTVGGGLAAMQAIDSIPRIAGEASQNYHKILDAYYQHGGK